MKITSFLLPRTGTVGSGSGEERSEWERRASRFKQTVLDIQTLFVKLCTCQNRELVYDIYTYLWDMCMCVQTLDGFVQWLAKGEGKNKRNAFKVRVVAYESVVLGLLPASRDKQLSVNPQ